MRVLQSLTIRWLISSRYFGTRRMRWAINPGFELLGGYNLAVDIRQGAAHALVIQSVSNHKVVFDLEPHVCDIVKGVLQRLGFEQKRAYRYRSGVLRVHRIEGVLQ